MRDVTVARSYAETLFALAQRHEGLEVYEAAIGLVARLLDENPGLHLFLQTPRIAGNEKKRVLRRALEGHVPGHFLSFLFVVLDKRRQRMLREIAREYNGLMDHHFGRMHVEVTVARDLPEESVAEMADRLSELIGKRAIPHVRVRPYVLGGMQIRAGDVIYDGTVRRRMEDLRRALLTTDLSTLLDRHGEGTEQPTSRIR